MPYTAQQQAKLDAAQKRLDAAKSSYQSWVYSYNDWVLSIQGCYKDPIPDAVASSTWFNSLNTGPCTSSGKGCTNSSIVNCKAVIEKTLNPITIPNLKSAYNEQVASQANYDKVLAEVTKESQYDPANVLAQHQLEVEAETGVKLEEIANKQKTKNFLLFLLAILVIGGLIIVGIRAISK